MISNTNFTIVDWHPHAAEIARLAQGRVDVNLPEIEAECACPDTLLLRSDDGYVVATLRGRGDGLDLFVRLAVGHKVGAFRRAEPDVMSIARELGASTISFGPGRAGWKRLLGPQWSLQGDEYMRSVHEQES